MQHIRRTDGGSVIYDSADWKAGLVPQGLFGQNQDLKSVGINGFSQLTTIDPFTVYGILSPGTGPSANATNNSSLAGLISAFELTDNSNGLGVDVGGKIQSIAITSPTPVISTSAPFPHTITGTTPIGQDGILYRHNYSSASVVSFFFSYYNNSQWNIGICTNTFAVFEDDFMSVRPATPLVVGDSQDTLQKTYPHIMEIGADGLLYIGSGRYLHAYDGNVGATYGTFYSKVLTLPQGTVITGLKKYQDVFLITANFYSTSTTGSSGNDGTGVALLYVWDYTSLDIISVTPLEDFYVSGVFLWKGNPVVMTTGGTSRNGRNKIKVVTGNSVTTVASFNGVIPIHRGAVVVNDIIYLNAGGKVITVGDRYEESKAVNHISSFRVTGASGVLFYNTSITNINLTGSASDGSTSYQFNHLNSLKGDANCSTPGYSPIFPPGKIGRVKFIEIEYYQIMTYAASNGDVSLSLATDSGQTNTLIVSAVDTVDRPLIKRYTRGTAGEILPKFATFSLSLSWNTSAGTDSPTISRIVVDYELLEIKN